MPETNVVRRISKTYTYAQIAERIREATGRIYSKDHIGNVARGSKRINDKLLYNLERAFPQFFVSDLANGKKNLTENNGAHTERAKL